MRKAISRTVGVFGTVLLLSGVAHAGDRLKMPSNDYALIAETIADGLSHPWALAFLPDGRFLVTERNGALRIVAKTGRISAPVDGLPAVFASGQGGLLDVALFPDFEKSRRIALSYAESGDGGAGTSVLTGRLSEDDGKARLEELKVILRTGPKSSTDRHFGSRLVFARDGSLFVTLGDRGEAGRAQNPRDHAGSIARVWPNGDIPSDNPYFDGAGGLAEIWSIGHRNPQGAALNPETGALWAVEHGARGGDEINIPLAGNNYGWPVISYGRHYSGRKIGIGTEAPGYEQPVYFWDPSIAPSGMAFYTGDLFPAWRGDVFVGALRGRHLVRLDVEADSIVGEERLLEALAERIRDVRVGPDGALYVLTDSNNGRLIRVTPTVR